MIRRTALLSALTLSLLLSACSKNKDEATEDNGAQAASEAQEQAQAETETPAAPPPKLDYWKLVSPLVAGTYTGACMRSPDMHKMDGTIVVGADGKASSAGMEADFHQAAQIMLTRSLEDQGAYAAMAVLSADDAKGGSLTLQTGGSAKLSNASFGKGDLALTCSNTGGADKLSTQPLYLSLLKLMNAKKQTISCLDAKNLMVRTKLDVEIDDGVIKFGGTSFDIKSATTESFTIRDSGETLMLSLVMPDERTLNAGYDGAGKLTVLQAYQKQESTHHCMAED